MKLLLSIALLATVLPMFGASLPAHHLFIGTYTKSDGKGIYAVELDPKTGGLSEPTVAAEVKNPPWITFSPDKKFLYTVSETDAQAVGFALDGKTFQLTPLPATSSAVAVPPSYVAVDATGKLLITANYGKGYVATMPIHPDGTLGAPTIIPHSGSSVNKERQASSHVHSVTFSPDNRFAIICDLGLDRIFSYAVDPANAKITPSNPAFVTTEPGAGPRHFKFGPDGHHAYAINEMGGSITQYDYNAANGALTAKQTVPTLPADFKGENTCAEVRVHPNGKFLYGSNRGHDSIAIFSINSTTGALTPVDITPSGGKTPRNFAFSPDGAWLVCAHQDSNDLVVFKVDDKTGRITRVGKSVHVPMPVCVLFYD